MDNSKALNADDLRSWKFQIVRFISHSSRLLVFLLCAGTIDLVIFQNEFLWMCVLLFSFSFALLKEKPSDIDVCLTYVQHSVLKKKKKLGEETYNTAFSNQQHSPPEYLGTERFLYSCESHWAVAVFRAACFQQVDSSW